MAFIVETISGDRRIQLGYEEFIRRMTIGTNWTKIRIGLRLALNGSSSLSSSAPFFLGVCQGANGFLSPVTTDYFGAKPGNTSAEGWTFTAGAPGSYNPVNAGYYVAKKTGSTITNTGIVVPNSPFFVSSPATNHSQFFLDITKGSPNYTTAMWAPNSVQVVTDVAVSAFLSNLENETAPGTVTALGALSTNAYSGAALFDSVSVVWTRSTPTVEISDIAVCRFL